MSICFTTTTNTTRSRWFSTNGYVVNGRMGHALYAAASIFIGILIIGVIGWFAGEAIRRWAVLKRYE